MLAALGEKRLVFRIGRLQNKTTIMRFGVRAFSGWFSVHALMDLN